MKTAFLAAVVGALACASLQPSDIIIDATPTAPGVPSPVKTVSRFAFSAELPKVAAEMAVFGVVAPAMDARRFYALTEQFDLEGEIDEGHDVWTIRNGGRMLEASVRTGTGYLRFSDEEKLLSERQAVNLPSDDVAVEKATSFLSGQGWLPENAVLDRVGYYEFAVFDASGKLLDRGVSAVSVIFKLTLAGLPVEGPGAKISATFGDNGSLIGAARVWRDVGPSEMRPTLSPEAVVGQFRGLWPEAAGDQQTGDVPLLSDVRLLSVVVETVHLAYYAEPGVIPQDTIKPVYVFTGYSQLADARGEGAGAAERFEYRVPAVE